MNEWIKSSERLPDEEGDYIVYGIPTCISCWKEWRVREATWKMKNKSFEFGEYDCPLEVSHWMPLPEKPND